MLLKPLSYYAIRTLAMATMLIDHIGVVFWPDVELLRAVGRMAYPLYAFGIACGWMHTRNRQKYIWRLLLVALMAQVFWPLLTLGGVNVVAGFVAVLLWMSWAAPRISAMTRTPPRVTDALAISVSWVCVCVASVLLGVDYAFETMVYVPLNCALLWLLRVHGRVPVWLPSLLYVVVSAPFSDIVRLPLWAIALLAPAVVALHKEGGGAPVLRESSPGGSVLSKAEGQAVPAPWWFHHLYFWFYPAHLALLYTVAAAIG